MIKDFLSALHVPIALVASQEIISLLASPPLTPVLKFLCSSSPGLYSCSLLSYAKCPVSITFLCLLLNLVLNQVLHQVLHIFTYLIDNILFLQSNTESFLFDSYDHMHDHGVVLLPRIKSYSSHLSILYISPVLPIIQNMCPFSGHPLCTSDLISCTESC